jgi:hypothetical protein
MNTNGSEWGDGSNRRWTQINADETIVSDADRAAENFLRWAKIYFAVKHWA